jgi:hypothetical protein
MINFPLVNQAAKSSLPAILARLVPGGKTIAHEYMARSRHLARMRRFGNLLSCSRAIGSARFAAIGMGVIGLLSDFGHMAFGMIRLSMSARKSILRCFLCSMRVEWNYLITNG